MSRKPTNQTPENQPNETEVSTTSTTDDGLAALQGVVVPDISADDADADAAQAVDEDGNVLDDGEGFDAARMTQDAFWTAFKGAFKLGSVMVPGGAIPELAIQPDETDHARAASDATYDLIDAYAPSWLHGDRDQLVLLLTAGSFFLMKAKIVSEVIRARRLEPVNERPPASAAFKSARPQPTPTASNDPVGTEWETEVEAAA